MHQISKIKITVIGYLKNIIIVGETMFFEPVLCKIGALEEIRVRILYFTEQLYSALKTC